MPWARCISSLLPSLPAILTAVPPSTTHPHTARRIGKLYIADVTKKPVNPSDYMTLPNVEQSGEKVCCSPELLISCKRSITRSLRRVKNVPRGAANPPGDEMRPACSSKMHFAPMY